MSPWLIELLPALATLAGLATGRDDRDARGLAVGTSALTLLLAVVGWAASGSAAFVTLWRATSRPKDPHPNSRFAATTVRESMA